MKRLTVLLLLVFMGCTLNESPEVIEYSVQLEYSITGTAQEVTVEYHDNGAYVKSTNVTLPWTIEYYSGIIYRKDYEGEPVYTDLIHKDRLHVYVTTPAASGDTTLTVQNIANGLVGNEVFAEGVDCEVRM